MTETPNIEHRDAFYYTLHLHDGDVSTDSLELRELYTVLAGFFADVSINTQNWGGLATVDKDGDEVISGWFGSFGIADYVARNEVEKGHTKGARAYACIGEYGTYLTDKPAFLADPVEDDEPEPVEPAPACTTLDMWGI